MEESEVKEISYDIYQPFGPSILKAKFPKPYLEHMLKLSDKLLGDEKLSQKHDWSAQLAGNVHKEVRIPHEKIEGLSTFFMAMSEQYLIKTLGKDRVPEGAGVSLRVWVVSQYAGDFNPLHIHDANLSGVCFLKLPPNYEEEYKKEDHHPTVGCLEFLGSVPNHFANHSYLVKPEVGDFYLFPSWLTHQVYPFRSEGERRSMSFNVHLSRGGKGIDV
tara:strand:- start:296 stop:946 length:651 start_codon:yes stop_codon:yes gene_type:complete